MPASYPDCFDPYLRYAISTQFKNFEFFDEANGFKLFFLVEFKLDSNTGADPAASFANDMSNAGFDVLLGPAEDNTGYATLQADTSVVLDSNAFPVWDEYVSRVELSLPLRPRRAPLFRRLASRHRAVRGQPEKLLLGVLDDGCPFAAAQFLRSNSPASTRVRAIWDQDHDKHPIAVNDSGGNPCLFGKQPADFNYGLEFRRESDPPGPQRQMGLDEWIGLHLTPTGSIDEDSCYADAKFKSLMLREAHGAHVMDVLCGRVPTASRIGPTRPPQDHRDPPSWAPGDPTKDLACGADVVFVQFPEKGIRDSTGVWLKAYVLDGIRYIMSFAGPNTRVIINLSYGPTTGPHDGTAVLEKALAALVAEFDGTSGKPKLEIFLAVGNAYLTDGHVAFTGDGGPDNIQWTWRLPPDNTVLCFSEVWMKSTEAGGVTVTLTPPGGGAAQPGTPVAWGDNTTWLLAVTPTLVALGDNAAAHGDYTITVAGIGNGAQVDAYVARTDPNIGVFTGAELSHFVDPKWEQTRSAEADCIYSNGEFDNTGSLISRYGTLNGIATGETDRVHVAGGDMLALADGRKAPYSSAGPTRGSPREGPDYALFTDESYALEGVRAGGTRSGVVFRLIGTSAAAPQLARLVADSATPQLSHPTGGNTAQIEQRGVGDVAPPDATAT